MDGVAAGQAPETLIELKTMTWNVHGLPAQASKHRRERLRRIADEVTSERADLVAFQEAWVGSVRVLADALPGYVACFDPQRSGSSAGGLLTMVSRDGAWKPAATAPRFRSFSSSAPAWKFWQADGLAGKGALLVPLERRSDGAPLWLVNTHLQARYRSDSYRDVRVAQLRELGAWVHELGVAAPIVLAGDFNTPPQESDVYRELATLGIDVSRKAHSKPGAVTNYPGHSSAGWIDYVLVRAPSGQEVSCATRLILNRTVDDPYSDHHGLVAELSIGRRV